MMISAPRHARIRQVVDQGGQPRGLDRARSCRRPAGRADLDDDAPRLAEARHHGRHSSVVTPGPSSERPPRRDVSITSSSFFIASGTPLVVAPEIRIGVLRDALLEVLELGLDLVRLQTGRSC